jgi:hypothetical protein
MDDLKKLKHLIEHWVEHNDEHSQAYLEWAGRADDMGKTELSDVLRQIAFETRKMRELFTRAMEAAS